VKPAELQPLVGRMVDCYWNGQRIGKVVRVPKTDYLSVQFLEPHGRHTIELSQIRGVYWFKKLRTVPEFLALKTKANAEDSK